MANILIWHQGSDKDHLNVCHSGPVLTCPESKRIAAEYNRGTYTLTGVFNPNLDNNYYGREHWQLKVAKDTRAGDIIWFLCVPPKHTVYDVAAYGEETMAMESSLTSLSGMEADLVTAKFTKANEQGLCEPTGIKNHGTLTFPDGAKPDEVFVQKKIEVTTPPNEWLGVGLRVKTLPTGKQDLMDIRAKLAVVAHVFGYDAQTHQ